MKIGTTNKHESNSSSGDYHCRAASAISHRNLIQKLLLNRAYPDIAAPANFIIPLLAGIVDYFLMSNFF